MRCQFLTIFGPTILALFLNISPISAQTDNAKHIIWDTIAYPKDEYGWQQGDVVPNLKLTDVKNKAFELYDLLEKPLIIDFWFIACKPCVQNKKYLKSFYKSYSINLLSISVDHRASTVSHYAQKNGLLWQNVQDNSPYQQRFKNQIGYGNSYPDYFLITPDKKVAHVFTSGSEINLLGLALSKYFKSSNSKKTTY